jgi:hydrogenase-4 component F
MWVAMEATTLATAPGLYFNHNARSLEATWKFLLICSVGIALALLGSLLLAYSALYASESTLLFDDLLREAGSLSAPWLRAAFVLLLVGYGTKMGLAPMHTWKPDSYGEAPGMVGAIMAGCMTSCAFLAILRFYQIMVAAGKIDYVQPLLIFMGVLSMLIASAFMARQKDFKRMLAYSSVEHMGILVFGVGVGGAGVFFSLFHVINNGLCKAILFLAAANIHRAFGSKYVGDVQGACRRLPFSGWAFLIGFLAITGSPPFSPFVSEFGIVAAAFTSKHYYAAALFLIALFIVFVAFGSAVIQMVFGKPSAPPSLTRFHDHFSTSWPIVLAIGLVFALGIYLPPQVNSLLKDAADFLQKPTEWLPSGP